MSKVTYKANPAGFREIVTSAKVLADMKRRADKVAAVAGEGFEAQVSTGKRARGNVRATTPKARARNAKHHILEEAKWSAD